MFEPKFKLGDRVCSEEYGIQNAIIVGVKVYIENFHNSITALNYYDRTNGCDYRIVFDNERGTYELDDFSEQYLEFRGEDK